MNDLIERRRREYENIPSKAIRDAKNKVWRDCECDQCKEWSVWDTPDFRPHYKFDAVKGYTWSLIGIGSVVFWTVVILWACGG